MKNILVSIIIPTYNQSEFIEKTIQSALNQTYLYKEILICDDNSTDDTELKVMEISKDNDCVFYYKNKINIGRVSNYRNALYHHVNGEYVIVLDGDDYFYDKRYISHCIACLNEQTENVLFVSCSYSKQLLWREKFNLPKINSIIKTKVTTAGDYLKNFNKYGFAHFAMLYNVEKAKGNNFYSENISSSDLDSFFKLCLNKYDNVVIVSNIIAGIWVKHEKNMSSSLSNWKMYCDTTFNLYKSLLKHPNAKIVGLNYLWYIKQSFKPFIVFILRKLKLRF